MDHAVVSTAYKVSLPSSLLQNEEKATSCDTLGTFCLSFYSLAFVSAVRSSLSTTLLHSDSCQPAQQDAHHPGWLSPHSQPERKTTLGLSQLVSQVRPQSDPSLKRSCLLCPLASSSVVCLHTGKPWDQGYTAYTKLYQWPLYSYKTLPNLQHRKYTLPQSTLPSPEPHLTTVAKAYCRHKLIPLCRLTRSCLRTLNSGFFLTFFRKGISWLSEL